MGEFMGNRKVIGIYNKSVGEYIKEVNKWIGINEHIVRERNKKTIIDKMIKELKPCNNVEHEIITYCYDG